MTTASLTAVVTRCQDLPALKEEGGEAEDLSFSLWSLSSEDAGAAELLWETKTEKTKVKVFSNKRIFYWVWINIITIADKY